MYLVILPLPLTALKIPRINRSNIETKYNTIFHACQTQKRCRLILWNDHWCHCSRASDEVKWRVRQDEWNQPDSFNLPPKSIRPQPAKYKCFHYYIHIGAQGRGRTAFDRNARLMNKGQREGTIQVNTYLFDFHILYVVEVEVEVGSSGSISGTIPGGLDSAP